MSLSSLGNCKVRRQVAAQHFQTHNRLYSFVFISSSSSITETQTSFSDLAVFLTKNICSKKYIFISLSIQFNSLLNHLAICITHILFQVLIRKMMPLRNPHQNSRRTSNLEIWRGTTSTTTETKNILKEKLRTLPGGLMTLITINLLRGWIWTWKKTEVILSITIIITMVGRQIFLSWWQYLTLFLSSDYLDSGIDISHELSTYEPLPTPLPLADHQDSADLATKNTKEKE